MTHPLTRTSPKGTPFIGRCVKCNEDDFDMGGAFLPCPADGKVDEDAVLVGMIDGKYDKGATE
jgi:hypothetical protein